MVPSTDDYQNQVDQLSSYLLARREAIVDQWQTKCAPDEGPGTLPGFTNEAYTDQLPVLLTILTQRIRGLTPESDPVERAGQPAFHRWQVGYSLTKLLTEFNNFYDVLAEEFKQFLALYPQTQPQVIIQAQAQLLLLAKDVSFGSVQYVEYLQKITAAQPAQTLQAALDNHHPLTKQREDHLRQTAHDLRSHLGIISTAATLLQRSLKNDDRIKYMDMVSRNVKSAEHLLNQLLAYAQREANPASDND